MKKSLFRDLLILFAFMLVIVCVFFVFFGSLAVKSIIGYVDDLGRQAAIDGGVTVDAEVIGSSPTGSRNSGRRKLTYEYTDANGICYSGYGEEVGSDEVSEYIGRKIKIFIDGQGHSIPVGFTPDTNTDLTLSIVFSVIFVAGVAATVVFYCKLVKSILKSRRADSASRSETPSGSAESIAVEPSAEQKPDEKEISASERIDGKAVKYKLTVGDIDATDIEAPKLKDLENAVAVLKNAPETFVVLESSVPVDGITFVQATGFENGKCHAEAQVKDGDVLHIFGTDDMTEENLLALLRNFIEGMAPNIDGWKHVGDFR